MSEFSSSPEVRSLSDDDRLLTEVDHLIRDLQVYGEFRPETLRDVTQNLETATQEQAMPYAVTETRHQEALDTENRQRTFMWLGKTALSTAMSGYEYHRHEAAHRRVDIEVDEARHSTTMSGDSIRVFISPRMSQKDAPHEVAKSEHLAHDDSVRISWLETKNGKTERVMQSLLVRDVPLEAWVGMLESEDNIFGKTIEIEDRESALSVMKVHRELELPFGALENGPVSLVEAVIPYIADMKTRKNVLHQSRKYLQNQEALKAQAESTAVEWLAFEKSLAESLVRGRASHSIRRFIVTMQHQFNNSDVEIINNHSLEDTDYLMTRELAAVLESANQNLLNSRAAVITDNEDALKHVKDLKLLQRVKETEQLIQIGIASNVDVREIQAQQNRDIARLQIKPKGGCLGDNRTSFRIDDELGGLADNSEDKDEGDDQDRDSWVWKDGVCQVKACSTRPGKTKVGPCSVCKKCQVVFDAGGDPTKNEAPKKEEPATLAIKQLIKI